jgi:hypothetical protein
MSPASSAVQLKENHVEQQKTGLSEGFSHRELLMLGGLSMSLLSFGLSLINIRRGENQRKEDASRSEIENFWFKEIIMPKFITPILVFQDEQYEVFHALTEHSSPDEKDKAMLGFAQATTALQLSINTLRSLPKGKRHSIIANEIIETLEDNIQRWLYVEEAEDVFSIESLSSATEAFITSRSSIETFFSEARAETLRSVAELRHSLEDYLHDSINT